MKLKITIGLFLAAFLLSAQSARMNRDIEVAEKILETLLEENYQEGQQDEAIFFLTNNAKVEGTYVEGFGAMFSIASGHFSHPLLIKTEKSKHRFLWGKASNPKIAIHKEDVKPLTLEQEQENQKLVQEQFKNVVETFICDYGYLMRQLADDEKIMIRYGKNATTFNWNNHPAGFREVYTLSGLFQNYGPNYTATVTKKAIQSFQNDQISADNLKRQIEFVFEEAKDKKEKNKDLELLASVLKKVHKQDLEDNGLYFGNTSNYDQIEGIGAIFNWTVRQGGDFPFRLHTKKSIRWSDNGVFVFEDASDEAEKTKTKPTKEEKQRKLIANYQSFIKYFKENVIEYGSIVKNLKDKEALIFKLKLPKCDDCKDCLLYTSPSPRDRTRSRMPSSA